MTDRPIIFSAPMVKALLAGRKSMTRRVLKPQPFIDGMGNFCAADRKGKIWNWGQNIEGTPCLRNYVPAVVPFTVGDRLWVRETWQEFLLSEHPLGRAIGPRGRFGIPAEMAKGNVSHVAYRADGEWPDHPEMGAARWRSPIHMERRFSRLTLAVTDVRVQRLQDISEADAVAEGVHHDTDGWRDYEMPGTQCCASAADSYRTLWNSIHGKDAWDQNPWVAAITFEVATPDAESRP